MPAMASPSFSPRTSPTKLAIAPISLRPRASASSSCPTSKSVSCTRTRATLASRHRRKERDFVAGTQRRREIRHLLVDRDAPALAGRERVGPGIAAAAQLVDEARDGCRAAGKRHLLARAAEAFAQAGEVKNGDHGESAHQARAIQTQVLDDEARDAFRVAELELRKPRVEGLVGGHGDDVAVLEIEKRRLRVAPVDLDLRNRLCLVAL